MYRGDLNNWVGGNFFQELINEELEKLIQLVVLNVQELYSDVVLKVYLRREFCQASNSFMYCNSFHCDKELIVGEVSIHFGKKYAFIRSAGEFTIKNKSSSLYIRH